MPDRVERRASELRKGDRLDGKGDFYTVRKAKTKGKRVHLVVKGDRNGGVYEDWVKAKRRYTVVVEASGSARAGRPTRERVGRGTASGPLLNGAGQMTRWATEEEARDLTPPVEPKRTSPWKDVEGEDAVLVEELGAKLVGVEVEGGKLLVPPVTDATVLGHLLTMHGVRYDGATMAEAKAWAKEHDAGGTSTAAQVLDALTLEKAHVIHADLHKDLTAIPTPHWHREKAPR